MSITSAVGGRYLALCKQNAPKLYKVTSAVRGNVLTNLAGLVTVPDRGADPPFWIGDPPVDAPPTDRIIVAPNGLFTLPDIAAGRGPFAPPTPRLFTRNPLPFAVESGAAEPTVWLARLREWFDGDGATINGLQEWFGLLLTVDTRIQKLLLLIGPPRSGKGTILNVLIGLLGRMSVASMTFAALGEDFALESLLGKTVCIIPDARLGRQSDTAHVVERLLSISGGDPQTINRKHRPRVTTKLNTRFIIATNEIPRLPDASGALASRFHVLATTKSFLGKEDLGLANKLQSELPGILRWAAEGLVRLRGRMAAGLGFTPNAAAAAYGKMLADLSSPVRAFVRERCEVGPAFEVERSALYRAWVSWNDDQNREPSSQPIFGKDLKAAYPHVGDSQPWREDEISGERRKVRVYVGIGLRDKATWGDEDDLEQAGTCSRPLHANDDHRETHGNRREKEEDSRAEPVPACSSSSPDPFEPFDWCGDRDPGGTCPPGARVPEKATHWKQRATAWVEIPRPTNPTATKTNGRARPGSGDAPSLID